MTTISENNWWIVNWNIQKQNIKILVIQSLKVSKFGLITDSTKNLMNQIYLKNNNNKNVKPND